MYVRMHSLQPGLGWEEGMSSRQLETGSLSVDIRTYVRMYLFIYCRKVRCKLVRELAVVLTEAAACPESGGLHRSSTTGASSVQEVKNSSSFAP